MTAHTNVATPLLSIALAALGAASSCGTGRASTWEANSVASAGNNASVATLIEEGDAAWTKRDDETALRKAIAAWEKASEQAPNDTATLSKLSRAYYFLSDGHLRKQGETSAEYLSTYEKGVSIGERALASASATFKARVLAGEKVDEAIASVGREGIEPMYWYAACLGKWAKAKGFATQLGNKDRIRAVMNRVLELDPSFFHAAADRYFGAFYAVAPGFAGGDLNKSKSHFEKSLSAAPEYAGTRVLYAELWAVKTGDQATFEKLLNEVLAQSENDTPSLAPEIRIEKEKARELLARAKELF